MDRLKKKLFQTFILVFLASNLILSVSSPISSEWTISDDWTVSGDFEPVAPPVIGSTEDWVIYANELGIQTGYTLTGDQGWIILTAETNMINSSTNTLQMGSNGYLGFVSNESFTLKVESSFNRVQLSGDQNNTIRGIMNGSSHTINSGNTITVYWNLLVSPYVPITFLFWIVGLVMCFIGPYMGIKQFKKGDYRSGLILITVICAMGFSLLLGGMFSA